MAKRKAAIDYLFDDEKRNWIADISNGQVGAIAVFESLWDDLLDVSGESEYNSEGVIVNGDDGKLVKNILTRGKELSASKKGRGREDAVEMGRTKRDQHRPEDYGRPPRHDAEQDS